MTKKYYWIIDGRYYEVTKEQYQAFKKAYDHSKLLEEYENEVVILSLDAIVSGEHSFLEIIPAQNSDVAEIVEKKILNEELHRAINKLDPIDRFIIVQKYFNDATETEIGKELDLHQSTINRRIKQIEEELGRMMGVEKTKKSKKVRIKNKKTSL